MPILREHDNTDLRYYPVGEDNLTGLLQHIYGNTDETTRDRIENDIDPFLEVVEWLEPNNYEDPSIRKFFEWLVDTQRTVEEFNYVIGPVAHSRYLDSMPNYGNGLQQYLGLVAAEALAVKSPVLKGPWEFTAWLLFSLIHDKYKVGPASERLIDWVFRMMSDPNFCPSPCLRLEFMHMFSKMDCVTTHNRARAFEAVMLACSASVKNNAMQFANANHGRVSLKSIIDTVRMFTGDGSHISVLDQQLSAKLLLQTSSILHDVPCSYGLKPVLNTGSHELNFVTALFQITSAHAQINLKDFKTDRYFLIGIDNYPEDLLSALQFLLCHFKKTLHTPQLVDVIASCFMDTLELVILVTVALLSAQLLVPPRRRVDHEILRITDKLLRELCGGGRIRARPRNENSGAGGRVRVVTRSCKRTLDESTGSGSSVRAVMRSCKSLYRSPNVVVSPVGQHMVHKYHVRLSNLREQLGKFTFEHLTNFKLDHHVMIFSLLYHCNYDI